MNPTGIEWVKNPDGSLGYTWNPITGCRKGCDYCYARKLANGRLKERYLANPNIAIPANMRGRDLHSKDVAPYHELPFYPRFWPEKITEPIPTRKAKPKGIFVCSMSDLFGIGVPEEWTKRVLDIVRCAWHHRFYLLTKQPQNLAKFSPFPPNCYVGVTVTNSHHLFSAIHYIEDIEAKVKYISFEPLLESVTEQLYWVFDAIPKLKKTIPIDWLIIGTQINPTIQPKIEWIVEIVNAAEKAQIPVFIKNNLKHLCDEYEKDGQLLFRQEMPE